MSPDWTRRRFTTATAAILGGLGLASTTEADDHRRTFVLEQDGECLPVVPLSGEKPVEAFYDWGRDVRSWSSEGTRELQRSETSLLFLYRGPLGLSLVLVHDRADDETSGGVASFTFEGVPEGAEWAVKDDLYDAPTNVDRWDVNGTVLKANETTITDDVPEIDENESRTEANETVTEDREAVADAERESDGERTDVSEDEAITDDQRTDVADTESEGADDTPADGNATAADERTDEIDWWWTEGRTDGGALRGLAVDGLELEVDAAFGDDVDAYEERDDGEVRTWTLLSGDVDDPDRTELDPDEPLVLRTGACGSGGKAEDTATEEDETSTEDEEATQSEEEEETSTEEDEETPTEAEEETPTEDGNAESDTGEDEEETAEDEEADDEDPLVIFGDDE